MFCGKCGKEVKDGTRFCPYCGYMVSSGDTSTNKKEPSVMLDPSERVEHKDTSDSSKTIAGQGRNIGLILIIVSIIIDLFGLVTGFFPLTIFGTILFVVGILIKMFCP